ncbi:pilus assembly protein TadD [Shinella sp. SUS2]|jgi:Flp pilus assembly protein TadD|uniref:tetratricopeptide repeat protein n=1 Tax=unclassified Shinella TaxID=2643062 RepID=UPI0003C56A9B|nr:MULTISPECIES: tetratricopeptide repeat protein [unclassified Shinella]MCA0338245.1 tetratricopeptide repeat protein [Pseudomonadota bacterium]EYR80344.1 Flp pilus assembly protein TadD [Shinella sp. DD12]KNY18902.1 pilus assembly protein TadD [Shinella sp. SUS2]KOC76291.1 pilus assembly protein TadD [Shinella sp. GWS1]MDG4671774.1 tetratricopeptide repeat protein [Shinella sp. 838]
MAASLTRLSFRSGLLRGAALVVIATAMAGCAGKSNLTTGSIPKMSKPVSEMNATELRGAAETIGRAYEKNPKDRTVGINYANVLRMNGRNDQALAVMQQVAINNPSDRDVLAAYGKAQAAAGQLEQALNTILRAQTPDRPDWRLKSAEGAILDQLGRAGEARGRYREALDINPNEPSVLSNLGMSYLLAKDLKTAETYLRSAASQPGADSGVRQNLALAVGLQGRFQEAETIARRELTTEQAEANVAYLRSMMTQQNAWKKLAADDSGNTN